MKDEISAKSLKIFNVKIYLQFQKIDLSSKDEVIEKLTKEIQDLVSGKN
jgi:hypothetical protein